MEIRLIVLIISFIVVAQCANSEMLPVMTSETPTILQNELITPQNVDFSKCCASFEMDCEKLFYLAISAVNASNFEIDEIQSKMGYILFRAVNKTFLISISKEDDTHSMIKITPADNIYFFPYGVVYNILHYIDINKAEQLEKI